MTFLPRQNRWWLLLPLGFAAAAGGGAYRWNANPKGIDWINYCKIRPGMKCADVASILGSPTSGISMQGGGGMKTWERPDGSGFTVFTNTNDCVVIKSSYHSGALLG